MLLQLRHVVRAPVTPLARDRIQLDDVFLCTPFLIAFFAYTTIKLVLSLVCFCFIIFL